MRRIGAIATKAYALGFLVECSCGSGAGSPSKDAGVVVEAMAASPDAAIDAASGPVCVPTSDAGLGSSQGGGWGAPPPSCAPGGPGLTNCGAGSESCCTSLPVPGGMYHPAYSNVGGDGGLIDEGVLARISDFRLDKYLVTVGRFRQFVNAWTRACYRPPVGSGKHVHLNGGKGLQDLDSAALPPAYEPGWEALDDDYVEVSNAALITSCDTPEVATWTPSPGSQENLPINCLSWYDAFAFCIWDGGFLPSAVEWEYAAAGGSEERTFPWGSTPPGVGNQYAIFNCDYPSGLGLCSGVANIAPVGTATRGAGRWGQLDLAGDLDEWNLDEGGGPSRYFPCVDCVTFGQGAQNDREDRGGDFADPTAALVPPYNTEDESPPGYDVVGFRCARPPAL
ncbi:MAG: formylglycine-generating enzyme family protein [Polyangiaceae bacterium]